MFSIGKVLYDTVHHYFAAYFNLSNVLGVPRSATQSTHRSYQSNSHFWHGMFGEHIPHRVTLEEFQVCDWYPLSPGYYHTDDAQWSRERASAYVKPSSYAGKRVYFPNGKIHMIDGGIGSVRLRPVVIDGALVQFCTATNDGVCHSGIPLAIPTDLLDRVGLNALATYTIQGSIRYLPSHHDRYVYRSRRVPQVYVQVDSLTHRMAQEPPVIVTPTVFFAPSDSDRQAAIAYTEVPFHDPARIDDASDWIAAYVREHAGTILTDFDQKRPAFGNLPLSLENVLTRNHTVIHNYIYHSTFSGNTMIGNSLDYAYQMAIDSSGHHRDPAS